MSWDSTSLDEAAQRLREAREVVAFTGAGISAESGIPTFRDDAGLWREFPPEQFAHWKGLVRTMLLRPRRLAEFVHAVLQPIAAARPNLGHLAIAGLEEHTGVTVVTQNIDNLHQDAGSTLVRELHGALFEIVTRQGRFVRLLSRAELQRIAGGLDRARRSWLALPRTLVALRALIGIGRRGIYRPNVVLFGDAMAEPAWTLAREAIRNCDAFLQVGTSGMVWPAAMLPHEAKASGATVIRIDPTPGPADVWLEGSAGSVLPLLVDAAFG